MKNCPYYSEDVSCSDNCETCTVPQTVLYIYQQEKKLEKLRNKINKKGVKKNGKK